MRRHVGAASAGLIGLRGRNVGAGVLATLALGAALLLGVGAPAANAAPEAGPGWAFKANFGSFESFFEDPRNPVAVDGNGNVFGISQNDGPIKIYSPGPDGGTELGSIPTEYPRTLAVDPNTAAVYADPCAAFCSSTVARYLSDGQPTPTYTLDPTFEAPRGDGIAVDPTTGNLLVADPGAEGVRRYDTSGKPLATISTPSITPSWIASAPDGSFYVAPSGGSDITHFSAAGAQLGTISSTGSLRGLAYDSSRSLIVAAVGAQLLAYSPAGTLLTKTPVQGGGGVGLAVSSSGSLYEHTGGSLNYYAPGTVPGVEAPHVSALAVHSAHVSAEVDPGAGPPEGSVAHFEYSADGGQSWPFSTPDVSVQRTVTEEPDTVEADLTGLKGNADYLIRLVAGNSVISTTSASTPFHTMLGPPEVDTGPATSIAETNAELTGTIDTLGDQTTFRFEYGLTTSYGSKVPAGAEAVAGAERGARTFSRGISGLQPDTTYHYRLVAKNSAGEAAGADRTFTTSGGEATRVYERVSPAEKMGGAISTYYGIQAAAGGSAVAYSLVAAPANTESAVLQTRVMSRRAPDGWLNWQPLDPPQKVVPAITDAVTLATSPDFTHAMVVSNRVLTPGAIEGAGNIYIRDLETGEYTFVGAAPDNYSGLTTLGTSTTYLAGAPDFSWLIFVAPGPLADTGTSAAALYKWSRESGLEVQSRLPGTNAIATGAVRRPNYASNPEIFRVASEDGELVYFSLTNGEDGVYRRSDGQTTAISLSHRSGDDQTVVHWGSLEGVSSDGRYAFFRANDPLTDDTPSGEPGPYIYRYEASGNDIEFVAAANSNAIWGVGADGKSIYFEKYPGGIFEGTFAWRDGVTHQVTPSHVGGGQLQIVSPNGLFMAYIDYEEGGSLHLYDAVQEKAVCVSCNPLGDEGDLPASFRQLNNRPPEIVTDDGTMFFNSKNPLIAEDHNATSDVYQYHDGQLTLISSGDGPYAAHFGGATPDGSNVYFTTDQPLVSGDTDGAIDVYDARIGGGFPGEAAPPPSCEGESCRSPIGPPPPVPAGRGKGDSATPFAISKLQALTAADRKALVKGRRARLKLTVNRPGIVTLTGKAMIGKTKKKVVGTSAKAKAAGALAIPFALSKAAVAELEQKGSLAIVLSIGFGDANPKAVHLTLKAAAEKKGGRS